MDFERSDEQRMIAESLARFVESAVRPLAGKSDVEEKLPAEAIRGLAELGILGMSAPPELDGTGLDTKTCAIALETTARADASLAVTLAMHGVAVAALARSGDHDLVG